MRRFFYVSIHCLTESHKKINVEFPVGYLLLVSVTAMCLKSITFSRCCSAPYACVRACVRVCVHSDVVLCVYLNVALYMWVLAMKSPIYVFYCYRTTAHLSSTTYKFRIFQIAHTDSLENVGYPPCTLVESRPFLYCVTLCNVCFLHFFPEQKVFLCFGTFTCKSQR